MATTPRLLRILRRTLWQALPTVLAVIVIDFFLLRLAPGDAAEAFAAEAGSATEETMAALRDRFGLDQPLLEQFLGYLGNLAQFSLGQSPMYNMPVVELIGQRLPASLLLMGTALALALLVGIAAGALMAAVAGSWPDRALSVLLLLFYSVPGFWIGLMLVVVFSVTLGWLPSGGSGMVGAGLTGPAALLDGLRYLILPATTLALFYVAIYARLVRSSMLAVTRQDFIRTAVAKGLPRRTVLLRHVLRNALLPLTTVAGVHAGGMIGGAVVAETVFAWPGIGRLAYDAVLKRDFTVVLGILLLSALLVILVNMLVDLLQAWLDPRIEVG
ncbi:ABC transporter permease [Paracraurococcus lichenis]|uniref:ABC transporter permease n=1 Tax=Paracraurococcus lichenis TaxID=3064888 RepID=A0ABT9E9P2_9PROT|nr:ABC transporter permease [Paracraurococcus sp. LOR1-02]MDO9712876.1 ABC transporter permease [Paracraurococcus sp. LOR1-02]